MSMHRRAFVYLAGGLLAPSSESAPERNPAPWTTKVEWAYRGALEVFIAVVTRLRTVKDADGNDMDIGTLQVTEVLKGDFPRDLSITRPRSMPTDTFVPLMREQTTVLIFREPRGDLLRVVREDDDSKPYEIALKKVRELRR